jgi:hypothetical protein
MPALLPPLEEHLHHTDEVVTQSNNVIAEMNGG